MPSIWEEDQILHEVEDAELACLQEIEAHGCLTGDTGTNPVEGLYDTFGWLGGTNDMPIPWHGMPPMVGNWGYAPPTPWGEDLGLVSRSTPAPVPEKVYWPPRKNWVAPHGAWEAEGLPPPPSPSHWWDDTVERWRL